MSDNADTDLDEERGGRFSLERITSAVRRRVRMVGLAALVIAGSAAAVLQMLPNRYEGAAVVQIDPRKKSISNMDGVVSDLNATGSTVDSEVEVIRSRAIALEVIDILSLRSDPEFAGPAPLKTTFRNWWNRLTGAPAPTAPRLDRPARSADPDAISRLLGSPSPGTIEPERDEIAAAFAKKLAVTRVRVTLLMEIRFSSADPVKAARIANTIAEVYLNDQIEEKKRAAGFATGLLEDKLAGLKVKVANAERRVEQFKAEHNIYDAEGEILSEKQLGQQMSQTLSARSATAAAKAKYDQVTKLLASGEGSSSVAEVLQSDSIKMRKDNLAAATRRAAELETRYGPKHPDMQKVRAEVGDAVAQLDAEVQRVVANLKNEYEVAQSGERQQAESLTGLKQQQVISKDASVTLKALQREADTEKQLFEALLGRYKQTAETQNLQLPDSRIVERAGVALSPAAPKRKQILILAILGGLLAGIALALALEFAASGITHPEDVEHALELAHLSSVPMIGGTHTSGRDALRSLRMILAEPGSVFTEAIRNARREIDVRSRSGMPRLILVASSLPNEDSDIIASNLAHHYALLGARVLLIDGDLRRAALTRRLVPKAAAGLLDVLSRGMDYERAVLRDAATGLSFLPAMAENPLDAANPEMLASARMAAVFTFMKRQYDTIIVSAPPLLPVVDGRLLADHADQIVFVMAWRKTPKQLARRALKCIGFSQQKIAGVIMNQVEPSALGEAAGFTREPAPMAPRRAA